MKIFITGVRGFLGSSLAAEFRSRGWEVAGSARSPGDASTVRLALGDEPVAGTFAGVDVLLHAAYDPRAGSDVNRRGTERIFAAAAKAGVARQIFLSSYSARPGSPSNYGQMKYLLEQFFLEQGQTIVRPGMVTGGGMFERLTRGMLRLPVVPLAGGGRDLVPILDIGDFTRSLALIAEGAEGREFNLFAPELLTSRRVAELVLEAAGHRALLVPVPGSLLIAVATLGAWLRLLPPGAAGGVRAARLNRVAAYESHLPRLIGTHTPPGEAIRRSVAAVGR
ncbi:MAG: NAD(P)-dependent oxidoreductase [Acidobacteria bacterium]|nr:NAD(P)-dependent oxidoreductase [Acidobacteriota bacterium]